jgi:hypothetical protein
MDSNPQSPGYGGTRRGWWPVTRPASGTRPFVSTSSSERKPAEFIASGRRHHCPPRSTGRERGVLGAVFGRDADLDSHPPLRAQSCDPAMVHQHLEPNYPGRKRFGAVMSPVTVLLIIPLTPTARVLRCECVPRICRVAARRQIRFGRHIGAIWRAPLWTVLQPMVLTTCRALSL